MTTEQFQVEGSSAIVTGASRGIGQTIASRLMEDEVNVTICSREMNRIEPVAKELNEEFDGAEAVPVECDVRNQDSVKQMVTRTLDEFGCVDLLVNNAGASFMAPFGDISPNGWSSIVEINLEGTFNCIQAVEDPMKSRGSGNVINISSVAGQQGAPFMTHYGSAKAGIINLTRSLATEWSEYGIRVNCIAPGFVATEGVQEQMDLDLADYEREDVDRRVGLTDEIADIVQFLASPASSFIVGETITAQGVPPTMESPET